MVKTVFTKEYRALIDMLIAERKAVGMTQKALGRKLGRPQNFVSRYEHRQRRLDMIECITIVRALGIDPMEFMANVLDALPKPTKRRRPKGGPAKK